MIDFKTHTSTWKQQQKRKDVMKKYTAYAFPGGYPKFYFTEKNEVLCANCANKQEEGVKLTPAINYESTINCDECNEKIESAYGED